jgi:formylglycine-generating enzyme required for sulfatase activity
VHARAAAARFNDAVSRLRVEAPAYETRTPVPTMREPERQSGAWRGHSRDMVSLRGGRFTMVIEHAKRECGCYSEGADASARWGWYFEDKITHRIDTQLPPFAVRRTAVTNDEYLAFVRLSGYQPRDPGNFLKQIPREASGAWPARLPARLGRLPVTFVSLDDARAYARWMGERLPTEAEWQWAAEGAGLGHRWPWGDSDARAKDARDVNLRNRLEPADAHPRGATPQGVLGLTGNAWELTESEYSDGHTRFVMLRGGVYLPPAKSEWIIPRGPRPNSFHAKYILFDDALDRSGTVSFRTVRADSAKIR